MATEILKTIKQPLKYGYTAIFENVKQTYADGRVQYFRDITVEDKCGNVLCSDEIKINIEDLVD